MPFTTGVHLDNITQAWAIPHESSNAKKHQYYRHYDVNGEGCIIPAPSHPSVHQKPAIEIQKGADI